MKPQTLSAILGGLATVFIATSAIADPVAVAPKQVGNVEFITGGIGDEERTAIEAVKSNYNLYVMSAGTDGAFTGNMHLNILDKSGTSVLETDIGPLFYAKLADGSYTVEGTHNNQTKSEKISITSGKPQSVHFGWK